MIKTIHKKVASRALLCAAVSALLLVSLIFGAFHFDMVCGLLEQITKKDFSDWFCFSEDTRYAMVEDDELPATPYTWEGWLYFDSAIVRDYAAAGVLFSNKQSASKDYIQLSFTSQYRPYLSFRSGGVTQNVPCDISFPTDRWFLFAVVCNPEKKTVSFYCDGYAVQMINIAKEFDAAFGVPHFAIGQTAQNASSDSWFRGYVAEVAAYDRILTAAVLKKHKSELPTAGEGLIARWKMMNGETLGTREEKYQPLFCDLSGNGHHLERETVWFEDEKPAAGYTLAVFGDRQGSVPSYEKLFRYTSTEHLLFLGDIVSRGTAKNWSTANSEVFRTTVAGGSIPYSTCLGERDGLLYESSEYLYADFDVYSAQAIGESCPAASVDRWSIDTYEGISYLLLTLRVNPTEEEVAWANAVMEAHPECNVIVATHAYLLADGTRSTKTATVVSEDGKQRMQLDGLDGEQLWERLVSQHENVIAVISSHESYPGVVVQEDTGIHGNRVWQILCGSTMASGYYSLNQSVTLLNFTGGDTVQVRFYSPLKNEYYRSENQMDLPVALLGDYQPAQPEDPITPATVMAAVAATVVILTCLWCGWVWILKKREKETDSGASCV